jgi:formamidopyrimidine-DNA glycosylase
MPELPEVETVVRTLRPRLTGARIQAIPKLRQDMVSPPDFDLRATLVGQTIRSIHRRGKKIVFELETGEQFYIHLGMSGHLSLEARDAEAKPHTHLIVEISGGEMRFVDPRRFGGIFWLGHDISPNVGLGPEPLTLKPATLGRRLAKTKRPIKNALLDQKLLAGLGNIYADEALHWARIHPLTLASYLTPAQIARLNRGIKIVLRRALRHRGSTLRDYRDANGIPGNFQKLHRVYDRGGEACLNCKTEIVRIVLGGRSTCFCPKCQPAPKMTYARRRGQPAP